MDDAALYFSFEEKCRDFNLSKEQRLELVLNALVEIRFLKPTNAEKAGISSRTVGAGPQLSAMRPASIWSDTEEEVNLLVVEPGENCFTLCLLAQPGVTIAGRVMQLGDAIKVMNDRLKPLSCASIPSGLEQAV